MGLRDVMHGLEFSDAIIVGTIALKAVASSMFPITSTNLDIVVEESAVGFFSDWLIRRGYHSKTPNCIFTEYAKPFQRSISCTRNFDDRDMDINLHVVKARCAAYELPFYFPNTTVITSQGLFTGYSTLLEHVYISLLSTACDPLGVIPYILTHHSFIFY